MAVRAINDDIMLEPHNLEAEQSVLGACLIDRDAIVRLAPWLAPDDFYRSTHSAIWRSMVALFHQRIPIDMVTLTAQLRSTQSVEDPDRESYLADLMLAVPTAVHVDYYAGIVREAAIRRRLIHASGQMAQAAWNTELALPDVLARAEDAVHQAARVNTREGFRRMEELMDVAFERMDRAQSPVIETGIAELDRVLGGVQPGQSFCLAARPAVGKSSLAMQMAASMARRGTAVGFIAMEMTAQELAGRLIAMNSGVSYHRQTTGATSLTHDERSAMSNALGKISEWPLFIDDRSDFSLRDVLGRCQALIAEVGVKVIVIDYIQLMHVDGSRAQNRNYEIGTITKAFKQLALQSGITVIGLSQLSRASEHRSDPRPMLADLRDSGSLEQDADVVLFLHRPDQYDPSAEPGLTDLIVAKHRNGPTGTARMRFDGHTTSFTGLLRAA